MWIVDFLVARNVFRSGSIAKRALISNVLRVNDKLVTDIMYQLKPGDHVVFKDLDFIYETE